MENPQSFLLSQGFTGWNEALQAREELVPASHAHLIQDRFLGCEHPVRCAGYTVTCLGALFWTWNGEYFCPSFTQGQSFGWRYAVRVSCDLFFIFSRLFLSKGRSVSMLLSKLNLCSSCFSINIPSRLLFATWNTIVAMLWEGKLAANCSDGDKRAKINRSPTKCAAPEACFPMVLCLSWDWALIHAAALFSMGVRRGLSLSKCLYSQFVLIIEGFPACCLSGTLV